VLDHCLPAHGTVQHRSGSLLSPRGGGVHDPERKRWAGERVRRAATHPAPGHHPI